MKKILLSLTLSALILSGCQTQSNQPAESTVEADIVIENYTYKPSSLTVSPGQSVSVLNRDIPGHTVTSQSESLFDTGLFGRNQTTTFTAPNEPGEYPFFCAPHPYMQGVLIVEGSN